MYADLSGERILVEEFVQAPNIGQVDRLGEFDLVELTDRLAESFMHQIFDVGVYHADPHPGNILIEAGRRDRADRPGLGRAAGTGPAQRGAWR